MNMPWTLIYSRSRLEMSELETKFMLMPHSYSGESKQCGDEICDREIKTGYSCFIDLLNNGVILCDVCGKCLRYARKKATERGERFEAASQ